MNNNSKKSIGSGKIKNRREAIRALIDSHAVKDQQALVVLLKERYAMTASQPAISRDLRALHVGKTIHNGHTVYALPETDPAQEILRLAVTGIDHNEALVVVHTLSGLADFVGDYLDANQHPDILATLAGENVVFITPRSITNIESVYSAICHLLHSQSYKGI